jgi:hypothetical protein
MKIKIECDSRIINKILSIIDKSMMFEYVNTNDDEFDLLISDLKKNKSEYKGKDI